MIKFKNGEIEKKAYVTIGGVNYEVHDATINCETSISAENLNRAISECVKEFSTVIKITTDTEKGETITLPSNYKVGTGVLDVYLNGERLIKSSDTAGTDGHYVEVGEAGLISNQIKLTSDWNLNSGDFLIIVTRGEWENETEL